MQGSSSGPLQQAQASERVQGLPTGWILGHIPHVTLVNALCSFLYFPQLLNI